MPTLVGFATQAMFSCFSCFRIFRAHVEQQLLTRVRFPFFVSTFGFAPCTMATSHCNHSIFALARRPGYAFAAIVGLLKITKTRITVDVRWVLLVASPLSQLLRMLVSHWFPSVARLPKAVSHKHWPPSQLQPAKNAERKWFLTFYWGTWRNHMVCDIARAEASWCVVLQQDVFIRVSLGSEGGVGAFCSPSQC